MIADKIKLSSGNEIPVLGLGTWQLKGAACRASVKEAIELGYRHIDTAWAYDNHTDIAKAIKESGIKRSALFVTSKVWIENLRYDEVIKQCNESLKQLNTDYLNLYLIHWPNKEVPMKETLGAMKKLFHDGKIKAIGVSNFTINHLKEAMSSVDLPIAVNQVEFHPYLNQQDLLNFCKENKITVTAYSPLARGDVYNNNFLKELSDKYRKSIAQITLRWLLQKNIVVIPKASSKEHLMENMKIFDFDIDKEDMVKIDELDRMERKINPSFSEFED